MVRAKAPSHAGPPREVRIIGGLWKRSKLPVSDRPGLRPTPDRVRETLFNWLGQNLSGWRCLDAFAGTGALGFEAASRGATDVVLLERDGALVAQLLASKERLHAEGVRVERADAVQWMARSAVAAFDLILLDPPFDSALLVPALQAAARIVEPGGLIYLESPEPLDPSLGEPIGMIGHRAARAGAIHFALWRRTDTAP
jgi:16S rRNA (guanine(966)-N(2))-methyltransferase RsmD